MLTIGQQLDRRGFLVGGCRVVVQWVSVAACVVVGSGPLIEAVCNAR